MLVISKARELRAVVRVLQGVSIDHGMFKRSQTLKSQPRHRFLHVKPTQTNPKPTPNPFQALNT